MLVPRFVLSMLQEQIQPYTQRNEQMKKNKKNYLVSKFAQL